MDKTIPERRADAWADIMDTVSKVIIHNIRKNTLDVAELRFYVYHVGAIPTVESTMLSEAISAEVLPMFRMVTNGNLVNRLAESLVSCIQQQFFGSNLDVLTEDLVMRAVRDAMNAFAMRTLRRTYLNAVCK